MFDLISEIMQKSDSVKIKITSFFCRCHIVRKPGTRHQLLLQSVCPPISGFEYLLTEELWEMMRLEDLGCGSAVETRVFCDDPICASILILGSPQRKMIGPISPLICLFWLFWLFWLFCLSSAQCSGTRTKQNIFSAFAVFFPCLAAFFFA